MSREIYCRARIDPKEIYVRAELGQTVIQYVGEANPYTGEYAVTPDFNGTTLQTRQKYMSDNVTVNPIQVESVSNIGGGRTVYIGGII